MIDSYNINFVSVASSELDATFVRLEEKNTLTVETFFHLKVVKKKNCVPLKRFGARLNEGCLPAA